MKKHMLPGTNALAKSFFAIAFMILSIYSANAQCTWSGQSSQLTLGTPPCGTFSSSSSVGSGTYTYFNGTQGSSYTFSTCNDGSNTQLTVYWFNGSAWVSQAYNDDNGPICNTTRASITWTNTNATSGNYILVLNEFNCQQHTGISHVLDYRENGPAAPSGNPTGGTSICSGAGTNVTLNRNSTPPTGLTYYWQTSSTGTSTSIGSGSTLTVSPSSTTTYYVRPQSGTGCWGTASAGTTITVNTTPSPPTAPTAQTVCASSAQNISFNSVTAGANGDQIEWATNSSFTGSTTVASPATITVNVAVGTTTTVYMRSRNSSSGCVSTSVNTTATVNANPTAPTAPTAQAVCSNSSQTLTFPAISAGSGGNQIEWATNSSFTGSTITASPATVSVSVSSGSTTTVYFRSRASATGCVSTSVNSTATVNPVPAAPVAPAAQSTCSGSTQTFAFTSVSSGFGGDQIEWATNGGFTGSTVATSPTTITVNVPSGTTTNIFIRSRNSTSGCVSTSVSTSASVSSVPGATITVTEASGTTANDGVTCSGDAVSLTANPAGMTSYVWNNGLPNGQNQTVNPTGTTTYSVTVTNSSSCTAVATTTITVNPLPTPTISVVESSGNVNNDGTTCSGDNVTLTANPGGLTYSWSGGLGAAQVQNVAPTGTTVYTVTVTNGNACSNTVSATITVNPLPATTISVVESSGNSSNDGTTCSGDNVTLTANPSAQLSYAWNNSLPSQQVNVVAPTGTTSYSVTVTTVNNCSAAASATITVNPLPTPTIGVAETSGVANNDGIICSAAAVTLTGSAGFTNYAWNNALGSGQVKNVAPTATTTYTVTVTNSNNCSAAASTTITVNQYPIFSAQPVVTAVLCNGGNTGTITVSASTANNPLTYSNDNGSTFQGSNVFTGLTAGSYNLVITDAAACSTTYPTNPVLVTEPPVLTHTTAVVDASCSNVFDGKITVTATGGFGAYAYSLNGGPSQVGNVFSGLSSGVYTVLTTDANGCGFSTSDTIDNSYGITGSIQSQTNVSCFSGGNGAVTVQIDSFGVSPYSYSINGVTFQPGGITYTFTGLTAGNYIVTIRDSKGCSAFVPVTITQPAQLQAQIDSITNIACNGGGTGAIYISVNGGTAPFSYLWSNSATTQDITGLVAGTYNVAVLDANGCNASVGATITQPIALFLNVASYTNLRCFNDSSGSINVSVNGGVPPYNFNWSNGATTEDLSGLKANTYSLTVTDNNGCTQTASQTITEPLQLTTSASSANVTCNGFTNGSIDLTVSNGTGPYTYFWANGGYTTEDLNGIGAGSYTVVVTDANSCTASRTVVITQPAALVVSGTVTNLGCFGNTSGAIDVTVTGGTPVYVYQWSNGLPATEDQTGLNAGTYTVTVVDDFVCTASASFTLTQPTQALGGSLVATDVTCNGANNGSVNLTLTGGTLPYIYTWAPGGATTEDITGLGPNTYSVTAQDANGCSFTGNATVAEPAALVASIQGTDVSCFGGNNGAADLTVTGGNLGYTYLWSNFASTEDLTGLTAGTYTVIVTDTKSCQTITAVTITQPAQLVINGNVTNISCNGGTTGSVDLTVTGGAGQYSFAWSGGLPATEDQASLTAGTYTVTVTDANFCTASASYTITQPVALVVSGVSTNVSCNGGSNGTVNLTVNGGVAPYVFNWSPNGQTTEDLSGLSANTYSVTVTDANTCSGTASFVITEPAAITSSVAGTDVTCNGASNGSADLTVSGGTGPYTYLWSNFQATQDLANIGGGLYYVIIKDANGCEKRDSVLISEPAALVIASSVTNVLCNGAATGAIDLTVTGGTGAYSFAWSGGLPATEDQTGLTAGTYVVTVSDANSCTATATYTITQPAGLVLNATTTNVGCAGGANGSVDITVQGGVFPYSFNWSPNGQTTEDINGLSGGTYTVVITDANGCSTSASYTITEPSAIVSSVVGTDVTCNGASNGSADLTVSGGTGPYTYLWSNFQATQDLANIGGGLYYVVIKDANGCEKRDSVLISEPAALVIASSVTNVLCNGAATGAIDLTVTGGTGAYSFAWSGGLPATEDQTGLTAGTYVVTVSDANSCTATASYTITQPVALVVSGVSTNVGCNGGSNGTVNLTVSGGVVPYIFNWSPNGQTTEDLSGLSGGTYLFSNCYRC